MSDNTRLNPGSGGDLMRNIDRSGAGPKTAVVQLDFGGGGATERLSTVQDPLPVGAYFQTRSDTFTAAGSGTTLDASLAPCKNFALQVKGTGAAPTAWNVVIEASLNNGQFTTILEHSNAGEFRSASDGETVYFSGGSFFYFRTRCVSLTLGSATNIVATLVGMQ